MPADAWYKDWPEDVRAIGAKYPNAVELAKGHANLQALYGKITGGAAEVVIKPKEGATAEEVNAYHKALGRPDAPEAYLTAVKLPEGIPDSTLKAFAPAFHKAGIDPGQAQILVDAQIAMAAEAEKQADTVLRSTSEREFGEVKNEWGQKFDANIEAVRRIANEAGINVRGEDGLTDLDKIERTIGTKRMLTLFSKLGAPLMDDTFKGGGGAGSSNYAVPMSPAEADTAFKAKGADREFMARVNRGDPAAVNELDTLKAAKRGQSLADWRADQAAVAQEISGGQRQRGARR
jgi:hypothetical protein